MRKFLPDTGFFAIRRIENRKTYLEQFEDEINYSLNSFKENLSITIKLLVDNNKKEVKKLDAKSERINKKYKQIKENLIKQGTKPEDVSGEALSELENPYYLEEEQYERRLLQKDLRFSIDKQTKAYFLLVYGFLEHKFYELCSIIQVQESIPDIYTNLFHYIKNSKIYLNEKLNITHNVDKLKNIEMFDQLRHALTHETGWIRGNDKRWNSIIKLITNREYQDTFRVLHQETIIYNGILQNTVIKKEEIDKYKGQNIFFEFTDTILVEGFIGYVKDFIEDLIVKADCKYHVSLLNRITNFYHNHNCKIEEKKIEKNENNTTISLILKLFDNQTIKKTIFISKKLNNEKKYTLNNNLEELLTEKIKDGLINSEKFIKQTLLDKCDSKKVIVSLN